MSEIVGSAVFSDDGRYRYLLTRRWRPREGHMIDDVCVTRRDTLLWVMLNPSTADATKDDPTIRRCIGFAKTWGYSATEVVNIFGYRATDPRSLARAEDPVGPDNWRHIAQAMVRSSKVFAAFGTHRMATIGRIQSEAKRLGKILWCLGKTKSGAPRHPLYAPRNSCPLEWP